MATAARTTRATQPAANKGARASKAAGNKNTSASTAAAWGPFAPATQPAAPAAAPAGPVGGATNTGPVQPAPAAAVTPPPPNAIAHPALHYNYPKPAVAAQLVTLGTKKYSSKVLHTQQCWQAVQTVLAQHGGKATQAQVCAAGVPAHFVSYCLRRNVLAAA